MLKLFVHITILITIEAKPCEDNQHCVSCMKNGDCSTKCDNGYYGPKCDLNCSTECINNTCKLSNSGIDECSLGCKPGFYGTRCNIPCKAFGNTCSKCPQKCEGGFCRLGLSCVEGCQESYYGTACKSCPAWCDVCNRVSGTCEVCLHCEGDCTEGCLEECEDGYVGKFCEHSCSSRCKAGCDKTSGDCLKCTSGWFGRSCEKQCPIRCLVKICDTDGLCTIGCTQGWFGQRCESKCPEGCLDGYCDEFGICSIGCTHGLYGKKCDSRCGTGCANGICDSRGTCTDGCRVRFYGEQCKDKCSANCLNGECDDKDGTCKNCKKNYHGSRCEKSCKRCIDGSCSQDTGHCIQGCLSNYTGEFCQHECSGNCTADECCDALTTDSKTDKPSGAEISHVIRYLVGGTVVLVVAALLMYAVCRFQRNRIKRHHRIHNDTTDGQQQPQSDITATHRNQHQHVYCQLDEFTASPPHLPEARSSAVVWSPQTSSSTASPENVENDNETPPSFHPSIVNSTPCSLESTDAADSQPGPSVEHSYLTAIAPTGAGGLLSRGNSGWKVEDEGRLVEDANPGTYVNFRGLYRR